MIPPHEEKRIICETERGRGVESDRDHELLAHFWTLHAAVIKRDGLEDRMRAGVVDEELLDRSLAAAEGVLEARLVADGVTVRRYVKPTFAKPAPVDLRHEIATECEVVIEALAD